MDEDLRESHRCLAILAKSARPGRVKTRLIGELTAQEAADLHATFLRDLVEEMSAGDFDLRIAWGLETGEVLPQASVQGLRQIDGNLGQRLHSVLGELALSHDLIAAIGSDHPILVASLVDRAFDKLVTGADVVLGPAIDGGYYLVAMNRASLSARIFEDIPWSTEAVWQATLDRCQELNLKVDSLPLGDDVDTPSDLAKLVHELQMNPDLTCRRTRALLASWERLSEPHLEE